MARRATAIAGLQPHHLDLLVDRRDPVEIVVFGRPVMNWHAALMAVSQIDRVLRALEQRAAEAGAHALTALQRKIANLKRLRRQVNHAYLAAR